MPDPLAEVLPLRFTWDGGKLPRRWPMVRRARNESAHREIRAQSEFPRPTAAVAVTAGRKSLRIPRPRDAGTAMSSTSGSLPRTRTGLARYPNPAKIIAAESEVPVATVHRWIREARRRRALQEAGQSNRTNDRGGET